MHFGELIRSANAILGYDQKIDIKIKPFRDGSWITDFIIQHSSQILDFFNSADGRNLMNLLAFLGLNVKEGVVGLIKIIRFTKGNVSNFRRIKEGNSVTYISPSGEELEVSLAEHKLTQSPLIQNNYYNCTIAPFEKFPSTTGVSFKVAADGSEEQKITREDRDFFEQYASIELLEDVVDNITMLSGVFLKPKRGSYSGEEKAYSFIMGDSVLWPVTIDDQAFLQRLISGEIGLYSEDVLKANLEIRQKKDLANKILASYSIMKVTEYIQYEKPKQLGLEDIVGGG